MISAPAPKTCCAAWAAPSGVEWSSTIMSVMSLEPYSSTASSAASRSDWPIGLGAPFCVSGRIAPTRTGPVPTVWPTVAAGDAGQRLRLHLGIGAGRRRRLGHVSRAGRTARCQAGGQDGRDPDARRDRGHPDRAPRGPSRRVQRGSVEHVQSPPTAVLRIASRVHRRSRSIWRPGPDRSPPPVTFSRPIVAFSSPNVTELRDARALATIRRARRFSAHGESRPERFDATAPTAETARLRRARRPRRAPPIEPGLHVVATPIGNLGDVTLARARDARRRRRDPRRGHARLAPPARPLRNRDAARRLSRAQRGRSRVPGFSRGSRRARRSR